MKRLRDVDFSGKKVLLRADFNVPTKKGVIQDDARIVKTIPTINYLLDAGASQVLIISHFGRPKGREELSSLEPEYERLKELLDVEAGFVDDCLGEPGDDRVVLFENTRFYEEDIKNDPSFAKKLSHGADAYVFDAFGTAHRDHASTTGVMDYISECCIGLLAARERKVLGFREAKKPFVAIVGAAKVSDKIPVLEGLLEKVDHLLLGGALVFTFLKAKGCEVGESLVEEEMVPIAKELLSSHADKLVLPTDIVVSEEAEGAEIFTVNAENIPAGMKGLDVGDESIEHFKEYLVDAATIFWNGPLGLFEVPPFDHATNEIASYLSRSKAVTIIGGGDTEKAVREYKELFSHVSTGGGAALQLVAGKPLVVFEKLLKK